MIHKENYLVYDKESNTLKNLTEMEHKLLLSLMHSPEIKYLDIVTSDFLKAENKLLFIERLDEIFYFYFNPPERMFYFSRKQIEKVFEVLEKLKSQLKEKPQSKRQSNKTEGKLGLDYYFRNAGQAQKVRKELMTFLFDQSGENINGNSKIKTIANAGAAVKRIIKDVLTSRYSAKKLAEVFHHEFGDKLGVKVETIRKDYFSSSSQDTASNNLFELIKAHLN